MGNSVVVNNSPLTGDFFHDFNIMMTMSSHKVDHLCKTDPLAQSVCNNDNFWYWRIIRNPLQYHGFPQMLLQPGDYKKIYNYLSNEYINGVIDIIEKHGSEADIRRFYNWVDNHPNLMEMHA